MVIVFTVTIGACVVGFGMGIAIYKIFNPTADVGDAVAALVSIIASILSALLGLVAGRSDQLTKRPGDDKPSEP